jgi:GNAT superfamily N-acetyltransferase
MSLAIRHRDDAAPALAGQPELTFGREADPAVMAGLQGKQEAEMARRFAAGHRAYVARWLGAPAAWGWVATTTAAIGELDTVVTVPAGERYLWNFVTLESHRGRGIYPRLLDAIVRGESAEASTFWVAFAPENHASGTGMRKAGFREVAEMSFDASGAPALRDIVEGGAMAAARLLPLPVIAGELTLCWRCVRAGRGAMSCPAGSCRCDYQDPHAGCVA